MDLSPEFSSRIEASSAGLVVYETPVTLPVETQSYLDSMTSSTQTMESNLVTKKVEVSDDPWAEKEDARQTPDPGDLVFDRDRLTITLKAGTGYDAPWLVYHAASVEEGIDFLSHERYDELADLTARKGKELAKAFGGSQSASKPSSSGGWGNKAKSSPKKSQGAVEETENGYECEHGEAVEKSGKTNGRKWVGHFCPNTDRSDQCTPAFE